MIEVISFDKAMLSVVLTENHWWNHFLDKIKYILTDIFFNRDSRKYIQIISLPQQINSTKDPPQSELTVIVKKLNVRSNNDRLNISESCCYFNSLGEWNRV